MKKISYFILLIYLIFPLFDRSLLSKNDRFIISTTHRNEYFAKEMLKLKLPANKGIIALINNSFIFIGRYNDKLKKGLP